MRIDDASNEIGEYTWPDECLITLNGERVIEFSALQIHSSLKKRKDSSLFISYKIFNENRNAYMRSHAKVMMEIKPITT